MHLCNQYCFNSTLVRFKPIFFQIIYYRSLTFQFHFGPIQTGSGEANTASNLGFQFHFGPIQTSCIASNDTFVFTVSIPLWSDSNVALLGINSTLHSSFNSTLVRFKRRSWRRSHSRSLVSIPLWSDSNRRHSIRSEKDGNVSIPLWSDSNMYK